MAENILQNKKASNGIEIYLTFRRERSENGRSQHSSTEDKVWDLLI